MKKEALDLAVAKTKELLNVPYCCAEARAAANAWLEALGTEREAEETKKYLAELEEDIEPIDGLLAFAGSDAAKAHLGEEAAKAMLAHAKELKAAGAKYCDCEACSAAAAIVALKDQLL